MTGLRIERRWGRGKKQASRTLATISYLGGSGVELHFTAGDGEELGLLRVNDQGLMWYPKGLGARRVGRWENGRLRTWRLEPRDKT